MREGNFRALRELITRWALGAARNLLNVKPLNNNQGETGAKNAGRPDLQGQNQAPVS
jgi:hypothetical protein